MRQPNIILILTDHFRRDALGESTPGLQGLAERGVQFTNAYCASPLCQPARASIVTGLYPSQHGICGNAAEPIAEELRAQTFMQRLRGAGYATALIGKHHFLDRYGVGMDVRVDDEVVRSFGFDSVLQVVDDDENLHNDDAYTDHLRRKGLLGQFRECFQERAWECLPHPFDEEDTVDGFIGGRGVDLVASGGLREPFYLNLSFVGPHPPYWHPGKLSHDPRKMAVPLACERAAEVPRGRVRYQARSLSPQENRAHYMDKCALIDRYVGRLLEALQRRGLLDRTVLLFTSDHGENLGDFGIWDKRFYYEQCCGVPLLLSGPGIDTGRFKNRVSKALVTHLDLHPTICALAGIATPPRLRGPCRYGLNLLGTLRGDSDCFHGAVFAELSTSTMIRTAGWKMVFDPEQGGVIALYNLVRDPRELDNLAGAPGYEVVTRQLLEDLLSHRILLSQYTHEKEEARMQRVRVRPRLGGGLA